jgi:phosphohistidine phosphatase SixA
MTINGARVFTLLRTSSMLAEMAMGRQCCSQRTELPTVRTDNTSATTNTTVYGTEMLYADYDDYLDANANANAGTNAVDPSNNDEAYDCQFESSQLTPIRSNRNPNRPCPGRPRPRNQQKKQQQQYVVMLLSILVAAMLSISIAGLHVVYMIPTNPTTTRSRTTTKLYNHYGYSQQQPMHLNFSMAYLKLPSSRKYDPHDSHEHNHHTNKHDNLINKNSHSSDNDSNDKRKYNPKSLLLLRHAKSSWDDPSLRDFDRPLSPKGRQDAKNLGKYLNNLLIRSTNDNKLVREQQQQHHEHKHHSVEQLQWLPLLPPDIIYVSPSVRTRATLDLVLRYWTALAGDGHKVIPVHFEQALYDFELDDGDSNNDDNNYNNNTTGTNTYLDFVQHLDPIYQRVMIVGHDPAMEQLEQQLAGGEHRAQAAAKSKYPPGTFCELVLDDYNSNEINESDSDNNVDNNVKAWNTIQAGQGHGKVTLFVTPKQTHLKV